MESRKKFLARAQGARAAIAPPPSDGTASAAATPPSGQAAATPTPKPAPADPQLEKHEAVCSPSNIVIASKLFG